jgi:TRAP-type C4-dicarboxylate transport system permease small subunit
MRYYLQNNQALEIAMSHRLRLYEIEGHIAVACMFFLVLITLGNVLVRYFSDQSFAWTEEVSVFLMVVMTFAGAACVATRDQHIRIEFFYESGSLERQRALRVFSACVTALFFALLAYLFVRVVADEIKYAETTMGLGLPRWWFSVWMPLLCALISFRALANAWRKLEPLASGSAGSEGKP